MGKQRTCLAELLALVGAVALYRGWLRPWMYTWGAREDEVNASLRGDELVAGRTPRTTRAMTVDAPIADGWPWLVQIGEDRGGLDSDSLLERAVGVHVHSANTIHPKWQDLRVGDTVWLARRYGEIARQVVAAVEPLSHLVLMSPDGFRRVPTIPGCPRPSRGVHETDLLMSAPAAHRVSQVIGSPAAIPPQPGAQFRHTVSCSSSTRKTVG